MPLMNVRQVRQFVVVAEELHFGRAALRLHLAQPALSQSIQRLEQSLGFDLFNRKRRTIELTEAGRVYLTEVVRALAQFDLSAELARRAVAPKTEIRVGFIGPAVYRALPALLEVFQAVYPNVHIELVELSSAKQISQIGAGRIDVGLIAALAERPDGLETFTVERAGFLAAVPLRWNLVAGSTISLAEIAEHPFIWTAPGYTSHQAEHFAWFRAAGIMPRVVRTTRLASTSLSLVAAGHGCSIVPATASFLGLSQIKFLSIKDMPPYRPWELMMAWRREAADSPSSWFVDITKDHVRNSDWVSN